MLTQKRDLRYYGQFCSILEKCIRYVEFWFILGQKAFYVRKNVSLNCLENVWNVSLLFLVLYWISTFWMLFCLSKLHNKYHFQVTARTPKHSYVGSSIQDKQFLSGQRFRHCQMLTPLIGKSSLIGQILTWITVFDVDWWSLLLCILAIKFFAYCFQLKEFSFKQIVLCSGL